MNRLQELSEATAKAVEANDRKALRAIWKELKAIEAEGLPGAAEFFLSMVPPELLEAVTA